MEHLLYGAAYYDEYMPEERLEKDVAMMKAAGINVVRIAESTWSTCEPQPGVFDFRHVTRVLDAMEEAGISVIIGTPTYAVPTWMVKAHPEVLATTGQGKNLYGPRQNMDITNPTYLFYAERVIRKLMECTANRACVIGFQIDNETKAYATAGENVQHAFVKYIRTLFQDDLEAFNKEFGLDYWSNRVNAWEDFPDVRGTINGSLGAEFEKFQRMLVSQFLSWQADIVREYKRKDQFITQNFDFDWRGYSYGVQPDVNQREAAKCLTVTAGDIYHPSQDELTGIEIAMCGDILRSLREDNYMVMETEAQGFPCWTPFDGQLRLQAFSHLASGAESVMYWHWHSLHNAVETYWKGLLSHDFLENEAYHEAKTIGADFARLSDHLIHLKKKNDVAILVSNEALTALKYFPVDIGAEAKTGYNEVFHWIYDVLYRMNVECDIIWPDTEDYSKYKMIIAPALYAASENLLNRLKEYTKNGGNLVLTFKSGFSNEHVKVYHDLQPHILSEVAGVSYHQFAIPKEVGLLGKAIDSTQQAKLFMELLIPQGAEVLVSYDHPSWNKYAAITRNVYGKGTATYIGCKVSDKLLWRILRESLKISLVVFEEEVHYPIIIKKGKNKSGNTIYFYLNYSKEEQIVPYSHTDGMELMENKPVKREEMMRLAPWGFRIVEVLK